MNKRIKKKKQKQKNKQLCERYPFLIPHNRWTDKVPSNYNYDYTELINFPNGWFKAFGIDMLEELRAECIKFNYLNKLRIMDIKEKYGGLRFYVGPIPKDSKIFDIINKYEEMSYHYCMICGRPAETVNNCGWLETICESCQSVINNRIKQWNNKQEKIK